MDRAAKAERVDRAAKAPPVDRAAKAERVDRAVKVEGRERAEPLAPLEQVVRLEGRLDQPVRAVLAAVPTVAPKTWGRVAGLAAPGQGWEVRAVAVRPVVTQGRQTA